MWAVNIYHTWMVTVDGQNSCTTKDDDDPIIYRVLTIPDGMKNVCYKMYKIYRS